MSRIDVVRDGKKFKVMVNFGSIACHSYSTPITANEEAKKLKVEKYPHASIHLLKIEKIS